MVGALGSFDLPLECYAADVREIAAETVARFGAREWRLVVLTNEIHGHLGIYSTLGAKMGLRAKELFEAEGLKGHISVVSFAGTEPPVSCFGDGLQVGTGATVGHGLFSVSEEPLKRPEALFSCDGKSLSLRLKPEYETRIREDIASAVSRFGHSPAYWQEVRSLAIRYWSTWDRREIFR